MSYLGAAQIGNAHQELQKQQQKRQNIQQRRRLDSKSMTAMLNDNHSYGNGNSSSNSGNNKRTANSGDIRKLHHGVLTPSETRRKALSRVTSFVEKQAQVRA